MGAPIRVRGLAHRYPARQDGEPVSVLHALDLDVAAGEHVALTGPSGSGKSTLLALLGGLERPQEGTIEIGGLPVGQASSSDLAAYRRSTVGFVFQHFGLLDTLTALENVELACTVAGVGRKVRLARARELLAVVGLEHRAAHPPGALSGGERQRVAIARALANDPPLLLADEPTGNLDVDNGHRIVALLSQVNREHGCTLVVVTHDADVAASAQVRLRLSAGHLLGDTDTDAPAAGAHKAETAEAAESEPAA
jgi:putative ABC transport system ATP-binding protein